MTIDERLDRLTERHEALAQTVELLAHRIDATRKLVEDALQAQTKIIGAMGEGINGLLRIAQSHEKRLSHLEG